MVEIAALAEASADVRTADPEIEVLSANRLGAVTFCAVKELLFQDILASGFHLHAFSFPVG